MRYRSSNSRTTRQQETHEQVNTAIVDYVSKVAKESDAETLWLGLRASGNTISQSSFNNRLKKLVDVGLIAKRSVGYNKHLYFLAE